MTNLEEYLSVEDDYRYLTEMADRLRDQLDVLYLKLTEEEKKFLSDRGIV